MYKLNALEEFTEQEYFYLSPKNVSDIPVHALIKLKSFKAPHNVATKLKAAARICSTNFAKVTGKHLCWSPFLIKLRIKSLLESLFNKVVGLQPETLLKRYSITVVLLLKLSKIKLQVMII